MKAYIQPSITVTLIRNEQPLCGSIGIDKDSSFDFDGDNRSNIQNETGNGLW